MEHSEKDFQVLDALDSQEITTQRQLAEHSGISLGQVNYVLKSLLEKGLVKIGNFRKSPRKIGYVYLLTPKGLEAKSRLAADFVISKLKEYHVMRRKIAEKLAYIESKGNLHIVFIGPEIASEFVDSIIKENSMKLVMVGYCRKWEELKEYDHESFDMALVFDVNTEGTKTMAEETGISRKKLIPLL